PDYFERGLPRIDRLEFPRLADVSTRTSAFRSKQVDGLTGLTDKDAETIKQTDAANMIHESYKSANGDNLAINTSKPPFTDLRVRQAIFKAIDKQQLIDTFHGGQAWYF